MKRDWALIRRLLEAIESDPAQVAEVCPDSLPGFDSELVNYHIRLLSQAGLIESNCTGGIGDEQDWCVAMALTWQGHEFLAMVRQASIWNRVRETARRKGIELSFEVITRLARELLDGLLR